MEHANPIQIQKYLKGIDYPASKQTLIENAKKLGADDSICNSLAQLPDETFQTPADVSQAFKGASSDAPAGQEHHGKTGASHAGGKRQEHAPETKGDSAFVTGAIQASQTEIEMCTLALDKSQSEAIRALAQTMIDEHSALGRELEQLAQQKRIARATQPDAQHASALQKMGKLSDHDFDRAFIEQNLKDHETQLHAAQQCASQEQDRDVKALAQKAEQMFAKHLKMVQALDEKLPA